MHSFTACTCIDPLPTCGYVGGAPCSSLHALGGLCTLLSSCGSCSSGSCTIGFACKQTQNCMSSAQKQLPPFHNHKKSVACRLAARFWCICPTPMLCQRRTRFMFLLHTLLPALTTRPQNHKKPSVRQGANQSKADTSHAGRLWRPTKRLCSHLCSHPISSSWAGTGRAAGLAMIDRPGHLGWFGCSERWQPAPCPWLVCKQGNHS